jgi:hypothetical protein
VNGRTGLAESEDRWLLPYRAMQVVQIRVSYQLTLVLDGVPGHGKVSAGGQ